MNTSKDSKDIKLLPRNSKPIKISFFDEGHKGGREHDIYIEFDRIILKFFLMNFLFYRAQLK